MYFSEGVRYPDCLCFYPSRFQGLLQLCLRDCGECMQERKAAVIRAEGESESARLISEATKVAGPGLIELRRIEAAKDIASSLSKSGNVMYLPGTGSNMLLGINPGK